MRPILPHIRQKLYSREHNRLRDQVEAWRSNSERIVFTNGCFDILHLGHLDYLAKAASLGDRLIIAINSDASVSTLKGPSRPLQDEYSRAMLLAGLSFTDALCIFDDPTPLALITLLQPDLLVKGADYSIAQVIGATQVCATGGSVALLPYLPGRSTSRIVEKMNK